MTKRGLMTGILGMAMLGLVFTACESDSPISLEESLKDTPNLNLVPGATDVSLEVNKNEKRSYFTVEMSNLLPESGLDEGKYNAWCVLYDTPINSNGGTYNGVKLHSIDNDEAFKRVEAIINNKYKLMANLDADWKDIQVAIWSVLDFPRFDFAKDLASLPPEFQSDGQPTFNPDVVNQIVDMSMSSTLAVSSDISPCKIYVVETESGTQTLIIEECDTATARMDKSNENIRWLLSSLSQIKNNNWFTYIEFPRDRNDTPDESPMCDPGFTTYFMYAGQSNYAGLFCFKRVGDTLSFYYDFDGYYPHEIHTQIKTSKGVLVAPPGQYEYEDTFSEPTQKTKVYEVTAPASTNGSTLYIVAHAAGGFGTLQ